MITISAEEGWALTITDNGCGITYTNTRPVGNGLGHIRSRANICGWHISWQNIKGTRIHISPTPNCVFSFTE